MLPLVLFCLVFEFQVYLSKSLLALSSHPAAAILKISTWPQVAGGVEPTGNWEGIECGNFKMAGAIFTVLTVYPEESRIFTQEDKKNMDNGEQSER